MGGVALAILVNSSTNEAVKNKWATRWECFYDATYLFKHCTGKDFVIDVAAEPQTAKVERFYLSPNWVSEQKGDYSALGSNIVLPNAKPIGFDGLQCYWEDGWWCNPPFDLKLRFIRKAREEVKKGREGMMLIPYEPLSGWWRDEVDGYATMVFEPNGRYPFYEADGYTKKSGVNFGSVLVLFTARALSTPRTTFKRNIYQDNSPKLMQFIDVC